MRERGERGEEGRGQKTGKGIGGKDVYMTVQTLDTIRKDNKALGVQKEGY